MIYSNCIAVLHIDHLRPQIGLWYNFILLAKSLCRIYAKVNSIFGDCGIRPNGVWHLCRRRNLSEISSVTHKHVSSRPYFANCMVCNLYPEIDRVSAIDRSASNSGVTSNYGPLRDFGYATSLADQSSRASVSERDTATTSPEWWVGWIEWRGV